MKKLFIYYSNTGNGDIVAGKLKEEGYEIRKVIPKKDLPKKFFFKVMTGGFLAGIKHKSKLVNFDENIGEFDGICIGSPIWNGLLSSPINMALSKLDLADKKVTFILYAGSGEAPKVYKQIAKKISQTKVIILKEPKSHPEELDKLK